MADEKRNGMGVDRASEDPELAERARRRTFTVAYTLKVVGEADRCTRPG